MTPSPPRSESHSTRDEDADPAWIALLDEAWRLIEDGDLDAARQRHASAAAAIDEPEDQVAELVALAGALAAAGGDAEAARQLFARAVALDPERAGYPLLAAEVELIAFDDPDGAIELCDRALDCAVEEDELIDGVLLKAEALITLGDRDDEAREVLSELDGCAIGDPLLLCQTGDLHLTLGDVDAAERAYGAAVALEPDWADGHYGLGLVHHARGHRDPRTAAWLRTRALDLATEPVAWHLSAAEFDEVAERALAELPAEIRDRLANVPVFPTEAPSEEQIADGIDPRLLGLFSGVPLPHKSHIVDGQVPHLDAVYLYQRNLERASGSREHLVEEIRITVLHETAHFFGLEDHDLDAIGLG